MSHHAECVTAICGIHTPIHFASVDDGQSRRQQQDHAGRRFAAARPSNVGRRRYVERHQQVAVRRFQPHALTDGSSGSVDVPWFYTGVGLDLPTAAGPGGRIVDGCDEAMTLWSELVDVLRGH